MALARGIRRAVAALGAAAPQPRRDPNDPSTWGKVGRNEVCPCGSGKKYKQCHGAVVQAWTVRRA